MGIEYLGENVIRNNIDNANAKNYLMNILLPKYFPNIPVNQLNIGEIGIISEYLANIMEDGMFGNVLALNESLINKAILDESIYARAANYDLGYDTAVPATLPLVLEVYIPDILNNSIGNVIYIDKDTKITVGDYIFSLDYDITIRYLYINGLIRFETEYIIDYPNSISDIKTKYIQNSVSDKWLLLFINGREYTRTYQEEIITNNQVFTAEPIDLTYSNQLAGFDALYTDSNGHVTMMTQKYKYSKGLLTPFLYKIMHNEQTIRVSFSNVKKYWTPVYNSKINFTIYTCNGDTSNFIVNDDIEVSVTRTGDRYISNENLKMVAIPYSASSGGMDQPDVEMVRQETINAMNTAHVLSSDNDIQRYFDTYSQRTGVSVFFFKRRDDPMGRMFAMFSMISRNGYLFPTLTSRVYYNGNNTLNSVNGYSYSTGTSIITTLKSGNIWKYYDDGNCNYMPLSWNTTYSRDSLAMISGLNMSQFNNADNILPSSDVDMQRAWVNPFIIQFSESPNVVNMYNPLTTHESILIQEDSNEGTLEHFILNKITIYRNITSPSYHITIKLGGTLDDSFFNANDTNQDFHYAYPTDKDNTFSFNFANPPGSSTPINPSSSTFSFELTAYIQTIYGKEPKLGFTVYNTDPSVSIMNNKYIYDTIKEWIPITNDTFPLKVVVSVGILDYEYAYLELMCTERTSDNVYTYEGDIYTTDVASIDPLSGLNRIQLSPQAGIYGLRAITLDAEGKVYMESEQCRLRVYTLCKSIGSGEFIPDPALAQQSDFTTFNDGGINWSYGYPVDPSVFGTALTSHYSGTPTENSTYFDTHTGVTYRYYPATNRWRAYGAPAKFGDPLFRGFFETDYFKNEYEDLYFMRLMIQMRSTLTFISTKIYTFGLVPFIRYDIAVDQDNLQYVIYEMNAIYESISHLMSDRLMENTMIDFKLYNTSGRSSFAYISTSEVNEPDQKLRSLRLASVTLRVKFSLGVHREDEYLSTVEDVKKSIREQIELINSADIANVYISNIIRNLELNIENVKYLIFNGIDSLILDGSTDMSTFLATDYDDHGQLYYYTSYPSKYQIISVISPNVDDLSELEMQLYVPERIVCSDIVITHSD